LISGEVKDPQVIMKRFRKLFEGDYTGVMKESGDLVAQDLIDHIRTQQRADEQGSLAKNEPETIKRKQAKGKPALSLIDEGRLLSRSSYVVKATRDNATIEVSDRVRPSKGWWWFDKYKFFAISPSVKKKIANNFVAWVRRSIFG
jgi:hypothetical protein